MGVEALLSRVSKLRQNGPNRWVACCPAHEDRSPSLAIREVDGLVLLHCFAGCGTDAVLGALGLAFTDLFEGPLTRERFEPLSRPFSASDALACLSREAGVVAIVASDITLGHRPSRVNLDRVALAAGRIAEAAEYCHVGG